MLEPTCTNSTGAVSPEGLETDSLLAGNAFGVTVTEERLRGFVTTKEDIDTGEERWLAVVRVRRTLSGPSWSASGAGGNIQRFWSLRYRAAPSSGLLLILPMVTDGERAPGRQQTGVEWEADARVGTLKVGGLRRTLCRQRKREVAGLRPGAVPSFPIRYYRHQLCERGSDAGRRSRLDGGSKSKNRVAQSK